MVLYAPAICPDCGLVFRSDVAIAEGSWLVASYRSTGGICPRSGGRGAIPAWVYSFYDIAAQCRNDASDRERRSLATDLAQHLRRHRTAKRTLAFVGEFRGPWKPLLRSLKVTTPHQRRAQLTFLLWILTDNEAPNGPLGG